MAGKNLTAECLRSVINYDPETGLFYRIKLCSNNSGILGKVGYKRPDGYIMISVLGCHQAAHRLAWLFMMGEWPKYSIDHIDGNRSNNKFTNLRDIPVGDQKQNIKRADIDSRTKFLGVSFKGNLYQASINIRGQYKYLGSFKTPEEAHAAYVTAKRIFHPYGTL